MELFSLLGYLILCSISYFVLRWFWEQFEISNLQNKAVFITGCDTGFGHGLALKCLQRGMPVFAGCLTEKGASSLRESSFGLPGKLETLLVDVTNDESLKKTAKQLEEKTKKYGGLHGVVNNAGIVGNSFYDDMLTVEDYKKTADVNLWGVIRTTQAMKKLVKKANQELRPFGVSVHILEPGFFRTPLIEERNVNELLTGVWNKCSKEVKQEYGETFFFQGLLRTNELLRAISSDRVDLVVDAYFHALTARLPRIRYQIGLDSHLLFIPLSFLPSRLQDAIFQLLETSLAMPLPASLQKKHPLFPVPNDDIATYRDEHKELDALNNALQ